MPNQMSETLSCNGGSLLIERRAAMPFVSRVPPHRFARVLWRICRLFVIAPCMMLGCSSPGDELVVATNWPESLCRSIEKPLVQTMRIRWLRLPPSSDPTQTLARHSTVDVVLGGRPESHHALALRGRLQPFDPGDGALWKHVSRSGSPDSRSPNEGLSTLMDSPKEWTKEYARLILSTAENRNDPASATIEGVSLAARSSHRVQAKKFLEAIGESNPATPAPTFLPELLSAALFDSAAELREARRMLRERGDPARAFAWMLEAPPWPPASISRMKAKLEGASLVETLVGQIAIDSSSRKWLIEAFNRTPSPIDGAFLRELDEVENGRLASDPRFRSWLRAEWSSWTSQRYRRIARGLLSEKQATP